uniref:Uncharacterized protein n=3 Tax=Oryza TaxID=4527 RepID=A0A0E0P914_ORYRU
MTILAYEYVQQHVVLAAVSFHFTCAYITIPLKPRNPLRANSNPRQSHPPMKKQAAAARCNALFVDRFEKIMMYPLVASLEYIFCFGGWTASCVVFFHLIVSFYGTEMTENLCSCDGMTAEEAAAMRGVEACMLLSCAAQMAAAAAAMALTTATATWGRRPRRARAVRRASASVALAVAGLTLWLWCVYLRFLPGLRCFRCFGVLRRVAVAAVALGFATPVFAFVALGSHAVVRGDEAEWDE